MNPGLLDVLDGDMSLKDAHNKAYRDKDVDKLADKTTKKAEKAKVAK